MSTGGWEQRELTDCMWVRTKGCQMAKYDPFHSLDCAGMEGGIGLQPYGNDAWVYTGLIR